MKKVTPFFIIILITFLIKHNVYSQEIEYGVGGGLSFVLAPGNFTNDIDTSGRNFHFTSNYHLGGKFKMGFGTSPIMLDAYLYYSSFNGSKTNVVVRNLAFDYNTSTSLWTFGVGAEYHFSPKPLSPYTCLDIQFNNLNDQNFETVSSSATTTISTSGWTRLGMAIGAGVEFGLLQQLTLDAALKFNFLNMFGKVSGEKGFDTFTISVNLLYSPNISTGTGNK